MALSSRSGSLIITRQSNSKGLLTLILNNPSAVKQALTLNGKLIRDRPMSVDYSTTTAKAGYKINMTEEGNEIYNQNIRKKILREKKRKIKEREK